MSSPRGFGFSLAVRKYPGVSCTGVVCDAKWGLLVWRAVAGVLDFAGETPVP